MRFPTLPELGGDPAELAAAARACSDAFAVLPACGARPLAGAFNGLGGVATPRLGVLGGVAQREGERDFGWMLGAAPAGDVPFELVPVVAGAHAGIETALRGPIDVVSLGMTLVARDLLLAPLPRDPVAALVELCARARAAGRDVTCRPSFACHAPPHDADDRGRAAALRAVAQRHPELRGTHRIAPALRRTTVDRDVRLPGGAHTFVRRPMPALTVLVHGPGAELGARRARDLAPGTLARAVSDPAAALRAELRVRGDRYVLVAADRGVPDRDSFDVLVAGLESSSAVALAAPSAAALDGTCVLIAPGRFPQHIEAGGDDVADAIATLLAAARALRRGVRVPGLDPPLERAACAPRTASVVLIASSSPEVLRLTLNAAVEASRPGDELIAACAGGAATSRRILSAYPHVRIVDDAVDPLLAGATNRAAASARGDLVVFIADDVLLPPGTIDRLRGAFARIPSLGAAFPAVPGAAGEERVVDVQYGDLAELRTLAELRALERARDVEPIDLAVTPAFAVAREALDAVGGIDPAHGPTRRGIAGLVQRLRAAGYGVVRCDDALVHRFAPELSQNPAAAADAGQPVPAADTAAIARGFDPRDRVPFDAAAAPISAAHASHVIAVPVGNAVELETAGTFLAAAAAAFDASSPVRVDVLLDGAVTAADAVARVRPALAACGKPMEATVSVRVERIADLAAWRAAQPGDLRVVVAGGHARDALRAERTVDVRALSDLLELAVR